METVMPVNEPIAPVMPRSRVIGAYLEEARSECLRYMRNPSFMLPIMLFPAMFYLLFGVLMARSNGADAARYLLASYGVFGVMSPGLFGFGVSLALERYDGLLTLKRAQPMPPAAYLVGKMVMAMLVAATIALLLLALALIVAHVPLSAAQALRLFALETAGVVPFCALGLLLGTLVKGQGAPGMLNLVYLPMAFLSGLWFPLPMMPEFLQRLAPVWPSYHLNQLALAAVGFPMPSALPHVLVLAAFTIGFLLLAVRRLRRYG